MLSRNSSRHINSGQQHENVSLQKRDKGMKAKKQDGNSKRHQGNKNQSHKVPRKHVRVQTNRERKHARQMANDLDWDHQGRQNRHRAGEMLQVFHSRMFEPLRLIIKESDDRTSQRHDRLSRGRLESRDQPDQVAEQNEKRQRHEKRRVAFAMVADDLLALSLNKVVSAFKD